MRLLGGTRQRGVAGQLVVLAAEVELRAGLRRPESGDDGQLLLEALEALAHRGKRDAESFVLAVEPSGAEAELDPSAAHRIDLGHRQRQHSGVTKGR